MVEKYNGKDEEKDLLAENYDVVPVSQTAQNDEDEIDLMKLFAVLLDRIHYIILWFFVGAVLFNAYAYFMIHPTYQSTAKLYMVSASDDSVVNFSDLNIGQALTSDYEELIFSYPVMDDVIDRLKLDMTAEQLAAKISIDNPEDTRVLAITATDIDPEHAQEIVNTLVDVVIDFLPDKMSTSTPNVVQYGRLEKQKVGPGYLKYTLFGAVLFAGVFCIIILIRYITDDTIKNSEDLENEFGLIPLTIIPENDIFIQEEEAEKALLLGREAK